MSSRIVKTPAKAHVVDQPVGIVDLPARVTIGPKQDTETQECADSLLVETSCEIFVLSLTNFYSEIYRTYVAACSYLTARIQCTF